MQRLGGTSPVGKEPPIHLFDGETQADLQRGSDPQGRDTKSQAKLACRGLRCLPSLQESWGEDAAWVVTVTKCTPQGPLSWGSAEITGQVGRWAGGEGRARLGRWRWDLENGARGGRSGRARLRVHVRGKAAGEGKRNRENRFPGLASPGPLCQGPPTTGSRDTPGGERRRGGSQSPAPQL